MFNDELCPPRQKVNILKAIDLYEKGQIKPTDPLMYIQDGEVVELGHYNGGLPMWIEVSGLLVIETDWSCWVYRGESNITSLGPCKAAWPVCCLFVNE